MRSPTRDAILEAAEEIFGERGFSKTTLEAVASAAQVSRPLVYRYFGDKRELFGVVVDRVLNEWNEVLVAEASRTTPGTAHTLRLVLTACLDFAQSRTVLRGLLLRDARLVRSVVGGVLDEGRLNAGPGRPSRRSPRPRFLRRTRDWRPGTYGRRCRT